VEVLEIVDDDKGWPGETRCGESDHGGRSFDMGADSVSDRWSNLVGRGQGCEVNEERAARESVC
jgi:hypothetical protein